MSDVDKSKKAKKRVRAYRHNAKPSVVQEPDMTYTTGRFIPVDREINYNEFSKIAHKIPFTQKEWAGLLHISERTLQRYAKDNGNFNFGVTDRILQIDKVIKRGTDVFGSMNKFIAWLRDDPYMLEGRLSVQSLGSIEGINMVLTQLGRIEHGILA